LARAARALDPPGPGEQRVARAPRLRLRGRRPALRAGESRPGRHGVVKADAGAWPAAQALPVRARLPRLALGARALAGLGFALVSGLALLVVSPRFAIGRPSLVDDWWALSRSPHAFRSLVRFRLRPCRRRRSAPLPARLRRRLERARLAHARGACEPRRAERLERGPHPPLRRGRHGARARRSASSCRARRR